MASLVCISFLSFFLFLVISSASHQRHSSLTSSKLHDPQSQSQPQPPIPSAIPEIHQACNATRFRQICESSLIQSNHLPSDPTPLQILQSAIKLSSDNLNIARSMVQTILDSADNNRNRTMAAKSCLEVLRYSEYRISLVNGALPRGKVKDARAWMSAALAYQSDCLSGLKYVNDTSVVVDTMTFLDSLTRLSSNALSMMVSYDIFGNETETWRPPMTETDGFWEASGSGDKKGLGFRGGLPMNLMPEAIVCKNGGNGCNYKTVQEAVNAAPDNATSRFVIHIKEGVYAEKVRVPLEKKNVIFLGDGVGKTVITGSSNVGQPGMTTYNSSTVGILGDGFMAKDLTIENTAGAGAHQAVAFRSDSDMSVLENCEFVGNQDTLYAHSLRQFYKSCRIVGNVDFIFGNSASFFQDCKILVTPREEKPEAGETNVITAQGRTDPAQSTGFVFHNCVVNGTDEYVALYKSKPQVHKNFLGRPWKEYSRTVFIQSEFAALITPQGWMPWSDDFALKTLYYGEFENSGPDSNMNQRVPWSRKVPADHVSTYSVQNFIQGGDWIPSSQHRNNNNSNNNRGRAREYR